MGALSSFLFIVLLARVAFGACTPDSYSSLPNAPVYPTATLPTNLNPIISTSNPLTVGHWSETAKLSDYRPAKPTLSATPTQTGCPHKEMSNLKHWHDSTTWGGNGVPTNGATVNIPANTNVLISSCSVDPSYVFGIVYIPVGSSLIFGDAAISFAALGFNVSGALYAGSETCRLRNSITITLHGRRSDYLPLPADPHIKGISVTGSIDIHGAQYFPTWTRLAVTAKPGDSYIFIQDLVNWQPGQKIVITTTEVKDSRDFNRNEERTIVSVSKITLDATVTAIQLSSPLSYVHYGGKEYQAEVSLLSRNIIIQGDATNSPATDTANAVCTDKDGSTYPCVDKYLTGFGAHVIVQGNNSQGRFSGVEMFRVGQTNSLGRYPIHFHMMKNLTSYNYQRAYVQDSSVHDSYFRCYAIHGTQGVKLTQNTAYNAIGHCYFLEDGVEEDNIISYNQAAHVHPLGPYQNPSIGEGDSWWGQTLAYYSESSSLILPSDMAAGCFYITNTYNDIIGNAASGGWSGFAIPSLRTPVKLHQSIKNMSPANRPLRSPFRGNSAHSSGFWWATAGGIYVGGHLMHETGTNILKYTSGRSLSRDTCADPTRGTVEGDGCWDIPMQRWLRFEDNKVFLSNRGMQNWGNRAEIIRLELHDVSLAMNVFGKVWIDSMLMQCRSPTHRITWFHGCPAIGNETRTPSWKCNVRDYTYFSNFGGFQWYDVGQQHIVTNSEFRNCREDWDRCVYGSKTGVCNNVAVFTSLTHSDEFVPQLMQVSNNIKYTNVSKLWRFSSAIDSANGLTVSGRLQSWYDPDGSASQTGTRTMIGSVWANQWWKYNDNCVIYEGSYKCPLSDGDSAASVILHHNPVTEAQIGVSICPNGQPTPKWTCAIVAKASHFGSKNETGGLDVAVNAKITGPLIKSSGGWFIRFSAGTPKTLTLESVQVDTSDVLLIALPYPSDTTFNIYHKAATWCSTDWANCQHNFRQVNSVADVISAFGDAYYFNSATRTLYLRAIQTPNSFSKSDKTIWTEIWPLGETFSRGGQTLITENYQTSIVIEASCSTSPCAPQNDVPIPNALNPVTTTTTTGSKTSTTTTTGSKTSTTTTTASASATTTATTKSATTSTTKVSTAAATTSAKAATTTGAAGGSSTGVKPSTSTTAAGSATTAPKATTTGSKASTSSPSATTDDNSTPSQSTSTGTPDTEIIENSSPSLHYSSLVVALVLVVVALLA